MRAVIQRVKEASVTVDDQVVGRCERGLLVLLGVKTSDDTKDGIYIADKIANLRIFEDGDGKMNLSVTDIGGSLLVVSQFTLYGDCRKGRRPGFSDAASPEMANTLYREVVERLKEFGLPVGEGVFQAHMEVSLVNDGPVTMLLDSEKNF
ncbi:D-tyrosyl-tRNA(Tyr) deacylase [Alkalibacter rhizosphaerae]|uniref:D-aminoacyl-tRNA deacylase n=1 Tax=Alkalibacter rhizosphaerae TaxID=2815577 RepID=A0A974XF86_9FIRM|nr:D-aminoacyl-tRNA deacylase [Alkalibacter rhizosphaerae]QSX08772.1 D-tyrosyl-tRNA(Tyr) deacylase [Alkalibacter rhizosphaerae]